MDFQEIIDNNLKDHLVISDFNEAAFKDVELCLGIDEAGRGPVLGPMVYAALFCPKEKEQQLKEMECADSKVLSEKDREKIFAKLNEANKFCGFAMKVLSPHTISTSMLKRVKYNLNELSHDTAICLIETLYKNKNLKITDVYLDTVGDPHKYEMKLMARFPKLKIKVSKKADSLFPCVSAASICAKVTRDTVLKNWKFAENIGAYDFGSGYPGDPLSKKFLSDTLDPVFGFVKLVRFSWSTAALKIKKSCVTIKWPDNYEDGEASGVVGEEEVDDAEGENGEKKVATTKKPTPKVNTKCKMAIATATDKNNGSLLNFFQKTGQKRNAVNDANDANGNAEIVSNFLLCRKLKSLAIF